MKSGTNGVVVGIRREQHSLQQGGALRSMVGGKLESVGTVHLDIGDNAQRLTEEDERNLEAVLGHEIAENTIKSYGAQWRRFSDWARNRGVRELPAVPTHVAAYLAERAKQHGHKPATLRAAAAAISHVHKTEGQEDPCASEGVRNVLRSATRKMGSFQKQADGLTADVLEEIRLTACLPRRSRGGRMENLDTAIRRGRIDIAMVSLMRDALLRVSEAAALIWKDVVEEEDGSGRLTIRRSKTDTEGKGAIVFVSFAAMRSLKAIRGDAADDYSIFGLCRHQISRRIKRAAQAAGLGEGFSGHSPRVGMARDLARAGTELPRLMNAGRWRSPRMPALYTRNESVARGAVAQYYSSVDTGRVNPGGNEAEDDSPLRVTSEFASGRLADSSNSKSKVSEGTAEGSGKLNYLMSELVGARGNVVQSRANRRNFKKPPGDKGSITAIIEPLPQMSPLTVNRLSSPVLLLLHFLDIQVRAFP